MNNPVTAANSWAVGRSSGTFVLKVKVYDKALNYSDFNLNQSTFTLDLQEPDSNVTVPATENGSELSVSNISGTATDNPLGDFLAEISTVQIRIWQDTDQTPENDCADPGNNNNYWSGSAWQASEKWLGVSSYDSGTDAWTFNSAGVLFKPNCYYVLKSSAVDNAGNGESSFGSRRFKYTPPPSVTRITIPANLNYQKTLTAVSGTANSDTASLSLEIRKLSNNDYWNFNTQTWQSGTVSTGGITGTGWTFDKNLPQFIHNSSYTFRSIGTSNAGVTETGTVTNQVYFDTVAANVGITIPNQVYYNSIPKLAGTAVDPPGTKPPAAGVNKVWSQLKAANGESAGKFWDNQTSTFTASWNQAGNEGAYYIAGSSWEYTVAYPTSSLINGVQYEVRVKAGDSGYNNAILEGTESDITLSPVSVFNFDIAAPTATVTCVSAGQARSEVSVASGTLLETMVLANVGQQPGFQIQTLRVHIKDNKLNQYWTGSIWSGVPTVSTTAFVYQSSWSASAMPNWSADGDYTMWAEAEDKAGNIQTNFSGNGSSVTFTTDETAPSLYISYPQPDSKISPISEISGTANDPNYGTNSGIADASNIEIQVSYLDSSSTYYFDNATGFSSTTFNETSAWWPASIWSAWGPSSGTWIYSPAGLSGAMPLNKIYRVRARGHDNAVLIPNPYDLMSNAVASGNLILDISSPTAYNLMPSNNQRVNVLSQINGTAEDSWNVEYPRLRIYDMLANSYWMDGSGTCGSASLPGWVDSAAGCPFFPDIWNLSIDSSSTAGVFTWRYPSTAVGWPERDNQLRVETKVSDKAGNYVMVSSTFSFDSVPPIASILYPPVNGVTYSSMTAISGTSRDWTSSISDVRIKMWYLSIG
ncbi:MAG: Ig-like domain repeat protein, partial [Elusimicrobia bacterium]|nr:Ig-like domain repeat protein [Elusimicrobiota bacterium]